MNVPAITGGTRQSADVDDLLIKSIHECVISMPFCIDLGIRLPRLISLLVLSVLEGTNSTDYEPG